MTTTEAETGSGVLIPLREGMFEMPSSIEGTPELRGQRCTNCSEVFPTADRVFCANCCEEALEPVLLGTTGELLTYTLVRQQLGGSLIKIPYVIGRVRLPEGVSVQTIVTDVEPEDVSVGMALEICLKQVMEDDDGNSVVNFFFRPAEA
ncbi:MAG TPA: OB-fold domain-containing protein [Dehalococcoidia bacterium]|jgi:uncharacterized OB-fold protein|nr:OB-fold domain-containing protein [Dehalococcoidia bacterium]